MSSFSLSIIFFSTVVELLTLLCVLLIYGLEFVTLLYRPKLVIFAKPKSLIFLVEFRRELAQSTFCDAADPVVAGASDEDFFLEKHFSNLGYLTSSIYMYLIYWIFGRVEKLRIIYIKNDEFEFFVDLALFF